ncbi:Hypothetical protein PBC10988_20580 [Planctomycetales bacterium 10988]|nr:Hypothetical protein PBC10988_20580 [Planctomycetales bacterium 10988]
MQYTVQGCTRRCAASERELQPGETYYSVVFEEGELLKRLDYAADAWDGPPEGAVAWWKSKLPEAKQDATPKIDPQEALLNLFAKLYEEQKREDLLYVLSLLMLRKRVFRLEQSAENGSEGMCLFCPQAEAVYLVKEVELTSEQLQALQNELDQYLENGSS